MMDECDWTDRPLAEGASVEVAGLRITHAPTVSACLVSSDLDAGLAALSPGPALVSLFADRRAMDGIRIARDRAFFIGMNGLAGWKNSFAVSPATGLYVRFDLSGPALCDVLAEGAHALIFP